MNPLQSVPGSAPIPTPPAHSLPSSPLDMNGPVRLDREKGMLEHERIVDLRKAAKFLSRVKGKKVHSSAIWRWVRKGVGGVKLEARGIGRSLVTSIEAIERFSKARAEAAIPSMPHPIASTRHSNIAPTKGRPSRSSAQRAAAIEHAQRGLREAGI